MTLSFFRNEKFFPDVLGHFIILSNYLFVEIKSRVRSERIGLSFFRCFKKRSRETYSTFGKRQTNTLQEPENSKTVSLSTFHEKVCSFRTTNHSAELGQDGVRSILTKSLNQGIGRGWAPSHLLISKFEFSWLVSKTFSHQSERRGVQHLSPDGVVGHWARSILTKSRLLNTKNRLLFSQLQIHVLTATRNGCYSTKTRKMKPWYLLIAYLRSICSPSDCTVLS